MLEVQKLQKSFGDLLAVDNMNFTINNGEIMGLIGQNGAGKTTTFRMLLDLLTPDHGKVLWNGKPLTQKEFGIIGYLPEERGLYPKVSIEDQILYFAQLRGKKKADIKPYIDTWMNKFEVKGKKTDKIKSLSKGNQQKVQLISTLIHQPELIILDEPYSGLDPVNAALLENEVKEARQNGATIIFSSHNMSNVEELCDSLMMLRNGKQILNGSVRDIREQFGRTTIFLETALSTEQLMQLPGVKLVAERRDGTQVLQVEKPSNGKDIFDIVTQNGYIPTFSQQPPTLDEIFKKLVNEEKGVKQ